MGNEKTLENGITIKGATLLTAEEAEKLPEETRTIRDDWFRDDWWWLRSPGCGSDNAAYVNSDGSVYYGGFGVYSYYGAVRPALDIQNLESSDLTIGDQFDFGDRKFEVISDTKALCTESVGECVFREDWLAEDANVYETSDVKKFVDQWYEKALELELTKQQDIPPLSKSPAAESKQPSFRADGPDLNDAVKRAAERNRQQKTATPQSKGAPKRDDGAR